MNGIQEIFSNLGWREAVVLCIVVLTIYVVVMMLRFLQLPRPDVYRLRDYHPPEMRTPPPEFDAPPGSVLAGVWESPIEPRLDAFYEPLADPRPEPRPDLRAEARVDTRPEIRPTLTVVPEAMDGFAAQLTQKTLEGEVRQLRDQLTESREEIRRLREEMGRLSAAQKVSPLYNEAMALAVRGVDAAGVAGRCGISIAEAELVVALSKRPEAI